MTTPCRPPLSSTRRSGAFRSQWRVLNAPRADASTPHSVKLKVSAEKLERAMRRARRDFVCAYLLFAV